MSPRLQTSSLLQDKDAENQSDDHRAEEEADERGEKAQNGDDSECDTPTIARSWAINGECPESEGCEREDPSQRSDEKKLAASQSPNRERGSVGQIRLKQTPGRRKRAEQVRKNPNESGFQRRIALELE